MPAPMTAPMASMIRSPAPSTRLSDCPCRSCSSTRASMGLVRNNCMRRTISAAAAHRHGQRPQGVGARDHHAAIRIEGEADDSAGREYLFLNRIVVDQIVSPDPGLSRQRFDDIQAALRVEREALRPAEAVHDDVDLSVCRYAIDRVAWRQRGRADIDLVI